MTQAALKLALEALERSDCLGYQANLKAITAIKEALAQEQEPVAWQLWVGADTPLDDPMGWQFYSTYDSKKSAEVSARTINGYQQAPFAKLVPLYTTPPQRPWVSLTDEQVAAIGEEFVVGGWICDFAKAIEVELKEKNDC